MGGFTVRARRSITHTSTFFCVKILKTSKMSNKYDKIYVVLFSSIDPSNDEGALSHSALLAAQAYRDRWPTWWPAPVNMSTMRMEFRSLVRKNTTSFRLPATPRLCRYPALHQGGEGRDKGPRWARDKGGGGPPCLEDL